MDRGALAPAVFIGWSLLSCFDSAGVHFAVPDRLECSASGLKLIGEPELFSDALPGIRAAVAAITCFVFVTQCAKINRVRVR